MTHSGLFARLELMYEYLFYNGDSASASPLIWENSKLRRRRGRSNKFCSEKKAMRSSLQGSMGRIPAVHTPYEYTRSRHGQAKSKSPSSDGSRFSCISTHEIALDMPMRGILHSRMHKGGRQCYVLLPLLAQCRLVSALQRYEYSN